MYSSWQLRKMDLYLEPNNENFSLGTISALGYAK